MSLNSNKAAGPDGIYPRVLKELSKELAVPLEIIFRMSAKDYTIPQDWKDGHVSPIFKKGDKGSAENYRPVSLTAVACKLMEKFARDAIMNHLEDNNLLSKYQDGFVKGRSCVSQLLACIDTWTRVLDERGGGGGGDLDIIYLDFQKAFDTVPHQRLLQKLYAYGMQGDAHRWISNFLEGRRQRVVINGETSNWCPVWNPTRQRIRSSVICFIYK